MIAERERAYRERQEQGGPEIMQLPLGKDKAPASRQGGGGRRGGAGTSWKGDSWGIGAGDPDQITASQGVTG